MHKGLALVVLLLSLTVTPAMRVKKKTGHKNEIGKRRWMCGRRGAPPCPREDRKPAKVSQPFADPAPGCTKDVANAVAKKAAEDMETWNYKIMEQKPFIYRDQGKPFRWLVREDYHGNEVKKVIKEHFGTLDEKILIQKRLELTDATNNVFSWRNALKSFEALDGPCVKNCGPESSCRCATPPFSVRQLPYDDGEVVFYFAHGVGPLAAKYKVKVPLSCSPDGTLLRVPRKDDKWVIGNIYEKWCAGSATTCP